MTKRMLIDATHAEETRVVVLDGNRLEDFDVETSTKKQLKGNIYLAKIVRVEPSLQAAFVEYGGGRHGFLAFGEIHPDYYQIPVADRQRLLAMQAEEAQAEEEAEEAAERAAANGSRHASAAQAEPFTGDEPEPADPDAQADAGTVETIEARPEGYARELDDADDDRPSQPMAIEQEIRFADPAIEITHESEASGEPEGGIEASLAEAGLSSPAPEGPGDAETAPHPLTDFPSGFPSGNSVTAESEGAEGEAASAGGEDEAADPDSPPADMPPPETIGGETDTYDGAAEARARRASRMLRSYRIQEVIHRRQIMLVQVVKEERGTKGAALTTYISLAGRYCVLMPNSPRGGGISRKITSAADRRRLKEITAELEIPRGMGLIVRTAGANRPKPEIKRDCEYLMRLWDDIREHTMASIAPALIYEEASLIKRAIRDVYSRDVEEVIVDGEQGWRAAHDFMRMLMPSHARKVQLWRPNGASPGANGSGGGQPLFSKQNVDAQLDAMLSPTVQLRSGGYLVIAQTEALVSIDVNSGRSTRERGIEETALKTNLEAADEVARQLRLRDLAGLIVIDFIDMEARKHNAMVERRLKEALKIDRARIQVGHISHFGLLEMSRQRLRPSLTETNFVLCPHCAGAGQVRSTESSAIHVLRAIEDEGAKGRASLVTVHCAAGVMMYVLNHKRDRLAEIEARYAMRVQFAQDDSLVPPQTRIDRLRPAIPEAERPTPLPVVPVAPAMVLEAEEEFDDDEPLAADGGEEETDGEARGTAAEGADGERRRRRRRRRRTGRRETEGGVDATSPGDDQALGEPAGSEGGEPEPIAARASGDEAGPAGEVSAPGDAIIGVEASAGQPVVDPENFDENGLPRSRGPRRSRRGGRRRRREPGEETVGAAGETDAPTVGADERIESGATPDVAAPEPAPFAYTGPTPANPFGGQMFDIFDMMDAVEQQAPPPMPQPRPEPAAIVVSPAPQPPAAEQSVAELPSVEPEPYVAAPPPVAPETMAAAKHSLEELTGAPPDPTPPHATPPEVTPAAEPVSEPAVKPILVGATEAPAAERKRGWWRR